MPFDKVAQMMEELLSVQTDEETVRRLTQQVGSWMEAAQTVEVEAGSEPGSEDAEPLQRCVISADGAMISLVHTQWADTRTAGPDGHFWFTEDSGFIGRITTGGAITEFPTPGESYGIDGITAGPDGNLWFTEYGGFKTGRITSGK